MAGSSVNKSVRGLGATIAFFIGASIALETTSVNRAAGRGAADAYCSVALTLQIILTD